MYELTFKRQAIKALRQMPARQALHIRRELDELSESPDRRDSDVRPLRGRPGFRLRVGETQIIFERDGDARVIDVLRIASRGQAYR